jgi:hypothetical protein
MIKLLFAVWFLICVIMWAEGFIAAEIASVLAKRDNPNVGILKRKDCLPCLWGAGLLYQLVAFVIAVFFGIMSTIALT